MDKRVWLLPIAALAIAVACYWKVTRDYPPQPRAEDLTFPFPAPLFELPDQKSQMFRFKSYIGRHDIFLVFYDAQRGVAQSDVLNLFLDRRETLDDRRVIVIGISQALPQENIGTTTSRDGTTFNQREQYPFPLLTDLGGYVHQLWGRYDDETEETLTGTFHVNRAGEVEAKQNVPAPIPDPISYIRHFLGELDDR